MSNVSQAMDTVSRKSAVRHRNRLSVVVTLVALALAVPLVCAMARLRCPCRTLLLLAFLLPQAFSERPVLASATRERYQLGLADTMSGAAPSTSSVPWRSPSGAWRRFRPISGHPETATMNLGLSVTPTFATVSMPLAVAGVVASALRVLLCSLDGFAGTLFVAAPSNTTLPVFMHAASIGCERCVGDRRGPHGFRRHSLGLIRARSEG